MIDFEMAGSFFIGGMVLLTIMAVNVNIQETSSINLLMSTAQKTVTDIVEILEYDVRKVGHGVPRGVTAILAATDSTLTFMADIDQDSDIDTIAYRVGSAAEVSNTENPDDRLIYRSVNGTEFDVGLGITDWELTYFTEAGSPTTTLADIRIIGIAFDVGTTFGYNGTYGRASWQSRIAPKNLGAF